MRVNELIEILKDQPPDAEVELAIVAPVVDENDDITVDRYSVEGMLPWQDDEPTTTTRTAGDLAGRRRGRRRRRLPRRHRASRRLMTPEERYRFDLQGFLVRRRHCRAGDVEALNVAIDVLGPPEPGDDSMSQRFANHLTGRAVPRSDRSRRASSTSSSNCADAGVRLDHSYGIIMRPAPAGSGLHGGGTPFDPAQYYSVQGRDIRTGLVAHPVGARRSCRRPRRVHVRSRQPPGELPNAGAARQRPDRRGAGCRPATSSCSPRR